MLLILILGIPSIIGTLAMIAINMCPLFTDKTNL
jgi:hypothetical protein